MPSPSQAAAPPAVDKVHIRVIDVRKSYGEHAILKGVSFDVVRGSTHVLVGVSGSGKTVLLRQLLLLEQPDGGRIEIDGQDIVRLTRAELTKVRIRMGMVFQDAALFDSQSVFDNVAFPLREHFSELSKREIAERVDEQLQNLGVIHARAKLPSELSGGMRKRVAVARAMVTNPNILIYDEPTRGLDPITSRTVDDLIVSTRERTGVTVIMISHDMKSVIDLAHHISLLRDGQIAVSDERDAFLISDDPRVRDFLDVSNVELPPELEQRLQAKLRR
jgi:phospholipid/cholesterol/gamma-HCH transport system ATP-binding protein